jgi:hypothetical protein
MLCFNYAGCQKFENWKPNLGVFNFPSSWYLWQISVSTCIGNPDTTLYEVCKMCAENTAQIVAYTMTLASLLLITASTDETKSTLWIKKYRQWAMW